MRITITRIAIALLMLAAPGVVSAQWLRTTTTPIPNTHLEHSGDNVGIGTNTPTAKLDVGGWTGKPQYAVGVFTSIAGDAFFGNVGANTGRMRVASNGVQGFFEWNVYYEHDTLNQTTGLKLLDPTQPGFEITMNANHPSIPTWAERDRISFKRYAPSTGYLAPPTPLMTLLGSGKVGINTNDPTAALHVVGNIVATGSIQASDVIGSNYQDIAEWVPATADLAAGTVVVLNPNGTNEVMPSAGAYDTSVAGVVSERPGIVLGIAAGGKEKIATYGRVKVRVDATTQPVRVGDLLVTGNKPGMAMRSEPIELQGRSFHQPGTIIGKALEPLAAGEGEILVLLSMQ